MLHLREATYEDMDLLYKWANDPAVRKNSFNSEPISYDNHVSWFNKIMEDNTVLQYILMKEDVPMGQIRLNIEGNDAEIGYSIAEEYRGKGYGHTILQLIAEEIRSNYPNITNLIAKVKTDNTASNMLFKKEGYTMEYACYSKHISR